MVKCFCFFLKGKENILEDTFIKINQKLELVVKLKQAVLDCVRQEE